MYMEKYGEAVFGTVKEENPCVMTVNGMVRGKNRGGIAVFRGIPYGKSTKDGGRFLPPTEADDWEGSYDATQLGFRCIQETEEQLQQQRKKGMSWPVLQIDAFPEEFGVGEPEYSDEDCLFLNVVTPGIDKKKRPILVYFHGGGFMSGSGSLVCGGEKFSREEDIVLVGVNHRLNVLGFLYLGGFDKAYAESGNVGLLDLVLALKWVQKNIEAFGGDPNAVTIMGESGGGMKVNALMGIPQARGLFRYAIVESGSMRVDTRSMQEAHETTLRIMECLGIAEGEWKKLLTIPAAKLYEGTAVLAGLPLGLGPVADSIHLYYSEEAGYTMPVFSEDIPLLVGASEDEISFTIFPSMVRITEETLRERLLEGEVNWFTHTPVISEHNVDQLLDYARKERPENTPYHTFVWLKSMAGHLTADAYREALAKAKQRKAPVYHYLVRYDSPLPWNREERYSYHTADLPLQLRMAYFRECEELSRKMAHSWAAFVRTGSPSTQELPWHPFTLEERWTMIWDHRCGEEADPIGELWEIFGREKLFSCTVDDRKGEL